ncbi:TIR domain-containing protein [Hwanghaeella sp.]|uniref:TIR domain-containing protein n=1 Tax=Hwanghaeella sp. TaxID=2605943 RepID=UPI003CCC0D25
MPWTERILARLTATVRNRFPADNKTPRPNYHAFISYQHVSSSSFAGNLEQALKRYAKPIWSRPLRIFRDENYIVPGQPLSELISSALENSENLIYLASPEASQSPWIQDELLQWTVSLERQGNLIIVLTDGDILYDSRTKEIDWTGTTVLPDTLRDIVVGVPYYVDMRPFNDPATQTLRNAEFKRALNQVAAKLRNLTPIEMSGREEKQHRRNLMTGAVLVGLVCLSLLFTVVNWIGLQEQSRLAAANGDLANLQSLLQSDAPDLRLAAARALNVMRDLPSPAARGALQEISGKMPQRLWFGETPRSPNIGMSSQALAFTADGDLVVRRYHDEGFVLSTETGSERGRIAYPDLDVLLRRVSADGWIPRFDRASERVAVKDPREGSEMALIVDLSTGRVDGSFSPSATQERPFAFNWNSGDFIWLGTGSTLHSATWPALEDSRTLALGSEEDFPSFGDTLAISDDGSLFATAYALRKDRSIFSSDQSFVVVDGETLTVVRDVRSSGDQLSLLAFEPGPAPMRIAVGHRNSPVRIHAIDHEKTPLTLEGSRNPDQLSWSPDGKLIALIDNFAETDGATIYETRFGRRICTIPQSRTQNFDDARFSTDGNRLYVSGRINHGESDSDFVGAYDLTACGNLFSTRLVSRRLSGSVETLAFNPDATQIVVSSPDDTGDTNRIFVVDARSGRLLHSLDRPPGTESYTSGISYTEDGEHIVETVYGRQFFVWTKDFQYLGQGDLESPSGAADDRVAFALPTALRLYRESASSSGLPSSSSPDGRIQATTTDRNVWTDDEAGGNCEAFVFGADRESEPLTMRLSSGRACEEIDALALAPDGSALAVAMFGIAGDENSPTGQELQIWRARGPVARLFCRLAGCGTWERIGAYPMLGQADTFTFSPSGRWLGLRDGSGVITVLDGRTFELHQTLLSKAGNTTPSPPTVIFSPDEKWLATPLSKGGGPARWRLDDENLIGSIRRRISDGMP